MVQFNLLPDIKQEFIRSQRLKRTVVGISMIAGAIGLTILILLFLVVNIFQKQHLKGVDGDIKSYQQQLEAIEDLEKVLTIQNQLTSLPALHDQKPVTSRLFKYLTQIVPDKISISKLDVDFAASTMTFDGSADSLNTVNKFADTLKFTTYKSDDSEQTVKAFSSVVLSQFNRDDESTGYTITLVFATDIFNSSKKVSLAVPKITTTRSEVEKPTDLFQQPEEPVGNTNNNQPSP